MEANDRIVLLIDNRITYLDLQAIQLVQAGYQVYNASSLEMATQLLQEKRVHLILADIRMEDDRDPEDFSGLWWAEESWHQPIPKIMVTGYPEKTIRETFQIVLDERANIIDFVDKEHGFEKLLEAIAKAFSEKIKINWDLVIRPNPTYSLTHLISLIEPDIMPLLLEERVKEFEDVLRQLFARFVQVSLGRIVSQTPGHVILGAFAYDAEGQEKQFLVSCGQREIIARETEHTAALPEGEGKGSTRLARELSAVGTIRFAASAYYLVGGDLEVMTSFSTFYRFHKTEETYKALKHLYRTTLGPWYKSGLSYRPYVLPDFITTELRPSMSIAESAFAEAWTQKIEVLCQQALTAGVARFTHNAQRFALHVTDNEPVTHALPTHGLLTSLPTQELLCGKIHGLIDGHSVRVGEDGTTWLINFTQTGPGALVRDFISLETHIKFDWLRSLNVAERYQLEQRLLAGRRLGEEDNKDGLSDEMAKAFAIIVCLRQLAAHYLGSDPCSYWFGLCAYAVNYLAMFDPTIRYTRGELQTYTHALLSIAMLCEALTISVDDEPAPLLPPLAQRGLWVDERNRTVWIEGEEKRLTKREYELLAYLYRNANQLCAREAIEVQIWGEDAVDHVSGSALDTLIYRLRKTIEHNPKDPKYIVTDTGHGFRLVI